MELLKTDIIAIIIALLGSIVVMIYTITDNINLRKENAQLREHLVRLRRTR
jgi:hypothetical protein